MKKRKSAIWLCMIGLLMVLSAGTCAKPITEPPPSEEQREAAETITEQQQTLESAGVETEKVFYSPSVPEGVDEFTEVELRINGEKIPLYQVMVNTSQTWNGNTTTREAVGVGYLELWGSVSVTVTLPYEIDYSSKVRPLSENIIPVADVEHRTLSFEISHPGSYIIEPNGDRTKAIHLFVTEPAKTLPQGDRVLYFGPGLHTAENSSLIPADGVLHLSSGMTVYIDSGAVVRAKFEAHDASNITITGHGIIDGSAFIRNAYTGEVTVPLDFNDCSNVLLEDISVLDPAGWCVNFYFITDSEIKDMKIITSRSNGDGISLQSCRNITVSGCFVRSWDDSLVVKNYPRWSDRSKQGETADIVFEDCILWTDLAQSMEIGYETIGSRMENITFRNITVLHALHRAPISIHNANNADICNVCYENITIEDASMTQGDTKGGNPVMEITVAHSETWSDQHTVTELGSVSEVSVRNLTVLGGNKNISIGISGCLDNRQEFGGEHWVRDITFENIEIKGKVWTQENANLQCNSYTENILVLDGKEKER